jgi:hypothetical protein
MHPNKILIWRTKKKLEDNLYIQQIFIQELFNLIHIKNGVKK